MDICFYLWAVMNNTAINIHVQVFLCGHVFLCLEHVPRSGIAGSYGNCNFLKNREIVF